MLLLAPYDHPRSDAAVIAAVALSTVGIQNPATVVAPVPVP